MSVRWYNDESAKLLHSLLQKEVAGIVARMCPRHELSHVGINRNDETDEIVLKLHLNPIGRVRVVKPQSNANERAQRLNDARHILSTEKDASEEPRDS